MAMFYFLWLDAAEKQGPFDVTKILASDPMAMQKPASPLWGPPQAMHHWGEPLFGYYLCDDRWVLRKHAQLLSDAGVDVIVFDASNKLTYRRDYTSLMETYRQMRQEGNRTPQVAFLTPFGDPHSTVHELYEQLYSKQLFPELWFQWEGKPLILADPARVGPAEREFFTFRKPQPDYFRGPTGPDQWGWLEVYPQHVFANSRGEKEQMTVGVAQNAVGNRLGSMSEAGAKGRSFHGGKPATRPSDVRLGYNFAEQWERALKEDPKLVFVTGWNEWVAGRFDEFNGVREPVMFVDEFDEEHSRDIEPMKGGHGDDYYYQLAANVRRFKGARPVPAASAPRTIRVGSSATDAAPVGEARPDAFRQWEGVGPTYYDDLYDTARRDHPGFAKAGPYKDDSGRNDFDEMKVARDAENLYFYVRTRDPITEPAGDRWMLLLLDTDTDHRTGWEGYDFLIDRVRPADGVCTLERYAGGKSGDWKWEPVGQCRLERRGKEMHLAVQRTRLGLGVAQVPAGKLRFDFKWADNTPAVGDVLDFLTQGDVAPNGRFNYRYRE